MAENVQQTTQSNLIGSDEDISLEVNQQNKKDNGALEECPPRNPKVPGSTLPSESANTSEFKVQPPTLRYMDQTPIAKQDPKRKHYELSPTDEREELADLIKASVNEAFAVAIPTIVERVKNEVMESMKTLLNKEIEDLKTNIMQEIYREVGNAEERSLLRSLSEAESLEMYNRRENIRIVGFEEVVQRNDRGKPIPEKMETTMKHVVSLANAIGAPISEADISIAHRLPSNRGSKPIIARFARRVAKVSIMQNKKAAINTEMFKDVKVYEDLTKPRLNFVKLMQKDARFERVWTREGTINAIRKDTQLLYKVNDLYQAGLDLEYNIYDVLNCFPKSGYFTRGPSESRT